MFVKKFVNQNELVNFVTVYSTDVRMDNNQVVENL